MQSHYEKITNIETNTKKSIKFFKYFDSISILLSVGIEKRDSLRIHTSSGLMGTQL